MSYYNSGGVKNTYRDFQKVDAWVDVPLSCEKTRKTPKKTTKPKTVHSPRSSSPIPDILINEVHNIDRDAYMAWKDHLHEPPTKMKVRGALFTSDEFISGHLVMRENEKREYNKENPNMPALNKCFVNLLINGPPPLVRNNHGNWCQKNYLPSCNCERDLVKNSKLPIGYRYNEYGFVELMVPSVNNVANYRDPMCIYTN